MTAAGLLMQARRNIARAWRRVLIAALTAGLAWAVARHLLSHEHPSFAAGAAVVCLAPGISSRGAQTLGMLAGVVIGVATGALAIVVSALLTAPVIAAVAGTAMLAAAAFGLSAIMLIQAGVSAILVLATGSDSGLSRLGDAAVGGTLGLIASQVVFTPDPARLVRDAVRPLRMEIAGGLDRLAAALDAGSPDEAGRAGAGLRHAHRTAASLESAVALARGITRWTLRGRLAGGGVRTRVRAVEDDAMGVSAAALLLTEAAEDALRTGSPQPESLRRSLRRSAALCRRLTPDRGDARQPAEPPAQSAVAAPPPWDGCAAAANLLARNLDRLARSFRASDHCR